MNAAGVVVSALLYFPALAFAKDANVQLTLDGRPVDRDPGAAVLHRGVIYADAIDLTKCFDGFITLRANGSAVITVGPNTGTFTPGVQRARINGRLVVLSGPPFMRNGDLFIPLDSFTGHIAAVELYADAARRRADIRLPAERR